MCQTGTLFDVQLFAVHDGPGIRTTVFLKGCNNRCAWCHNPESLIVRPQIEFYPARCIGCGKCFTACPNGAHRIVNGEHVIDRAACTGCGKCAETCYATALTKKGYNATVDQVMEQILADKPYYEQSGGGVTLSGGEPLLQPEFAREILMRCKQEGIHTAVQTAGNLPFSSIEMVLPYLDMVMYDMKGFAPSIYQWHIHGDRARIMDNLRKIDEVFTGTLAVRTPVIGSVNDTEEEIGAIAKMLEDFKHLSYYQLMPYHALGKAKYDALNEKFEDSYYTPSNERMTELEDLAAQSVTVFNYTRGYLHKGENA